jgi:ABC-2 type transport system ATP-binding protein
MANHALVLNQVSYSQKSNWSFARTPILKNIDLAIKSGESFGFLGHNGAGKTTTIKCILGLLRPCSGYITVYGENPLLPSARKHVGYLPELPYFYDHLSVVELVELSAELHNIPRQQRSAAVRRALDTVQIAQRSKTPLRALSKGLTQRVALAQAIVANPTLLILDEPFSGLDPIGRREFRSIFAALRSQGITLFISSHILSDVEALCDRVSILSHGEIKGVFETKAIPSLRSARYELNIQVEHLPSHVRIKLADDQAATRSSLHFSFAERRQAEAKLRDALELGAHLESFETVHGTLEDLFVELVSFDEATPRSKEGF